MQGQRGLRPLTTSQRNVTVGLQGTPQTLCGNTVESTQPQKVVESRVGRSLGPGLGRPLHKPSCILQPPPALLALAGQSRTTSKAVTRSTAGLGTYSTSTRKKRSFYLRRTKFLKDPIVQNKKAGVVPAQRHTHSPQPLGSGPAQYHMHTPWVPHAWW